MTTYYHRGWSAPLVGTLALLLSLMGLSACQQDDMLEGLSPQEEQETRPEELRLLSVRSSGTGQTISLSFSASLEDEEEALRSKTYADEDASGAYGRGVIAGEERARCILRRKGDAAATTYIDIVWKGRSQGRIKFDDLKVRLPEGVEVRSGDEWYMLAIMGGDAFDMQTGRVSISAGGKRQGEGGVPAIDDASLEKIPYLMNWTRLDIAERELATPITAQFRPMGTLLRLQFLSNMIEPYRATALRLSTNAVDLAGSFDPMAVTDEQLSAPPSQVAWHAATSSTTPIVQDYHLQSAVAPQARALDLPGGAGWNRERSVYIWGMPRAAQSGGEPLHTEVSLEVVPAAEVATTMRPARRVTYSQQGHRAFRYGATYRLSNVLTSDLIISEVFYDYAQSDPFASTTDRPNYSIVEIYNPTLSSVDLNHYALARLRYDEGSGTYRYHKLDADALTSAHDQATVMQLSLIAGHGVNSTFGNRVGKREGNWRRHIYTKGSLQHALEPGQTLLIAAGGYMLRDAMPDRNLYMLDEARRRGEVQDADFAHSPGSAGYASLQARLRGIERAYLPHAGGQPDTTVRLGMSHAMVALDNGSYPNASPSDRRAGTMQLGMGQGVALIKFVGSVTTDARRPEAERYVVSDVTAPVGSSAAAYRAELLADLRAQGLELPALDDNALGHYAYTRPRYDDFPHAHYEEQMARWAVTVSENQGIKSLGTRHYVAGLSPYQRNYSGYTRDNNPEARPFWSQLSAGSGARLSLPKREWVAPPTTGGNAFSLVDPDLVTIAYGEAPSQPGEEISKAFDGDAGTIYHSPHNRRAPLPLSLNLYFDQAERVDYMLYTPRRDAGQNGRLLEVDILYSADGTSFQPLKTVTFVNNPNVQRVDFDTPVTAKAMRLIVRKGVGGFASAAEIEFRRHAARGAFDWRTLFTDESCGVLRSGVTPQDIQACPDPLYKDIARRLLTGSYDEFRVAEYKPYLNPSFIANATKTWPYSVRDNPTGISVQAGDVLHVRVAEGYNRLRIVVQNLDHPNNDGFGGREYALQQGDNRISIKQKGLVYVLYFAENPQALAAARPIRIHFITGRVSGYYDAQNPAHRGRWKELLARATDPYFDVLGEHAHLTYPTWRFRSQTQDGHELIGVYDEIVRAEKELLGMYRYEDPASGRYRLPRNRMYLNVMYHQYMYATYHHTGYNDNADALSLTASGLRNGVWGVAHEIGHVNQTRPGLAWQGMDEVTVNIKSLYVQTSVLGRPSRWQVERDRRGRNRWYKSWNTTLRNKEYHGLREDGGPKLTPFWQLELYFGRLLGRTPMQQADKGGFYPDLYELIRREPNLTIPPGSKSNAPWEQSEFVYRASKVAGVDLTDYLEKWGFLKVGQDVEMRYDYGRKYEYTLPQERVDDVKRRTAALGLPRLPVALEFITDANYEVYKRRQPIVAGSVANQGLKTFVLTGWQNVVAFEFVTSTGEVLEYCEAMPAAEGEDRMVVTLAESDVDGKVIPSGDFILRAIAFDGTRVEVGRYPSATP